MGTPLYMSPEQAQGHVIDHRSDLYSLGVTFYHMLAGVPPFQAETPLALALKQVREMPRSMLIHRPDLPAELDRLVLKLMAKDPADRYQSAALMLADLAKLRDSLQVGRDCGICRRFRTSTSTGRRSALGRPARQWRIDPLQTETPPRPDSAVRSSSRLVRLPVGELALTSQPRVLIAHECRACLVAGAFAGWNARTRTCSRYLPSADSRTARPVARAALDGDPQTEYAGTAVAVRAIASRRDDWVPAFLAVVGYFPHSHDSCRRPTPSSRGSGIGGST